MAQAQAANTVYLTRLTLKNIRAFDDFTLNFTDADGRPRMRTLIIGRNGTNKTTLLRSIVLGLVDGPDAQGLMSLPNGTYLTKRHRFADIDIGIAARDLSGAYTSGKIELDIGLTPTSNREGVLSRFLENDARVYIDVYKRQAAYSPTDQ